MVSYKNISDICITCLFDVQNVSTINKHHALMSYILVTVQVIPHPRPRSARWISSSVPEIAWNSPLATHSSAEYHTNNLLSSVLFEEASRHIPPNAITIEIAPHGLLQAILHRSLSKATTNIALTQRGHSNCSELLLTALGRYIYC
jgi:fatty acid synthase